MEVKIPEIEAKKILSTYEGGNNQLLDWKNRLLHTKTFRLTRPRADYILKYHQTTPKVARKYIDIVVSFGEKLQEEHLLTKPVTKIWCEKLLCESAKAYHIWGKILDTQQLHAIWLPKGSVLTPEKKLNRVIDYSKYSHRPLKEWQPLAVEKLLANDRFILADDMGLGKMEVITNQVFTPYGREKIGNLKIGDPIIGSDGLTYNVNGVFYQGKKEVYNVTFNDGYSILCGKEHLFKVYSNNFGNNTKNGREDREIVLSVGQMLDKDLKLQQKGWGWNEKRLYNYSTYYKLKNGDSKWQIPIVKPIVFKNDVNLPINPYLLGLMLGDGHITKSSCSFDLHKDDYDELFKNIIIKENKAVDNKRKGSIYFGSILSELNLSNTRSYNKFVPDIYKYSSIQDRLFILQGLMDTDGYCAKSPNGTFLSTEYSTISEQLCDDVAEIVHSLGGIVRKSSRIPYYKKDGVKIECKRSYMLNIKMPEGMNPFRLKRKSELYFTPNKYKIGRYIKNIEKYGEEECVCISVDSPDSLYVTEHAIVTHNTTSAIIAAEESGVKKILVVCPASVKINWRKEIENYSKDRILIVEGRKWGSTFKYYIINYDILKNYHSTDKKEESDDYKLIMNEKFDLAIVDEAHYVSNSSANRTKLLNDILEDIPKVWLLTGTPMTSRPMNYYNLLKIVDSPVAMNWQHYVKRYCKGFKMRVRSGGTTRTIWNTSGATNLSELRERTKHIILRRLKSEVPGLPEKIISPIYLELHSTYYNEELEDFMRITEENKNRTTLNVETQQEVPDRENVIAVLGRLMKVRQVLAFEKVPYTSELIDKCLELNKKCIVFSNFSMPIDMLNEKYPKNSIILDGRMSTTKREEAIVRFQTDPKIKILIAQIIAGGIGINLTAAEVVIMNDLSFVPAHHNQAEDRAYRTGQVNNVLVYYPIFENTIEQIVYNILQRKKDVIDQVMGDGEYSEGFGKELIKELL